MDSKRRRCKGCKKLGREFFVMQALLPGEAAELEVRQVRKPGICLKCVEGKAAGRTFIFGARLKPAIKETPF